MNNFFMINYFLAKKRLKKAGITKVPNEVFLAGLYPSGTNDITTLILTKSTVDKEIIKKQSQEQAIVFKQAADVLEKAVEGHIKTLDTGTGAVAVADIPKNEVIKFFNEKAPKSIKEEVREKLDDKFKDAIVVDSNHN